jgi:hypothetical protein
MERLLAPIVPAVDSQRDVSALPQPMEALLEELGKSADPDEQRTLARQLDARLRAMNPSAAKRALLAATCIGGVMGVAGSIAAFALASPAMLVALLSAGLRARVGSADD